MGSLNSVTLLGNLGKDPEVKSMSSGHKVANFSIATSESWTDKQSGEKKEKTEWHNIVMWRGLAEVAEKYLKKGSQVLIEGKLQTRSWDKPDGSKAYMTEILADNLVMVGKRPEGSGGGWSDSAPAASNGSVSPAPEDDLPF